MTMSVTGSFGSSDQTKLVFDDLMANGVPREQVFVDKSCNMVKVLIADAAEGDIEAMLRSHDANELSVRHA